MITIVETGKKRYLELLLLADEQESMIDRYLEKGDLYVWEARDEVITVAIVTQEGDGVVELKNLAVAPTFQRQGYGAKMIHFIESRYAGNNHTLLVGTGDSHATLTFYKKCGFAHSHLVKDFFTKHYDHPIIEDGQQLKDMVYLKKSLIT